MTPSKYNQIKKIYKPAKQINEVQKMLNDISEITCILSTIPFNTEATRPKIYSANTEHPENNLFYFLLNPSTSNSIPVCNAILENLQQDLVWKRTYLKIKADAKTLDEIIRQLESPCNHSL